MISIIGDIAQWVAVVVIGGGLYVSYRRSNRNEVKGEGVLEEKINHLEETTGKMSEKTDKVLEGLNEMKEHCAGVTAGFKARIISLEDKRGKK